MKNQFVGPALTAFALCVSAGVCTPASGQNSPSPSRQSDTRDSASDYRSCHWLSDREVINGSGEEVAKVSDLIIDRGSGRIAYLVVKTGTTLGMGGRSVAIPYKSFSTQAGKDDFVMATTPAEMKQYAEYTPERWQAMKEASTDDQCELRKQMTEAASLTSDPYAGSFDSPKKAQISGEIKKVERVRTDQFGEQVIVTVLTDEGVSRRVALGPSWYVSGASTVPMRGDKATIQTLALPRDPDQTLAGTHYRSGDREMNLRDSDGAPAWTTKDTASSGKRQSAAYSRYVLASSLRGMKVDCRGAECGKVNDVILDRSTGAIGFISIDPNQNFMGIGDTKRLIPWTVATVGLDGTMRVDASKEMVLLSPRTPKEMTNLNTGSVSESVYKVFEVPAPQREWRDVSGTGRPATEMNAWSTNGPILASIDASSSKTMTCKVGQITQVNFENGTPAACAAMVKDNSQGATEEVLLLGPLSHNERQKALFSAGDTITVEACRAMIDGRSYWLARSIDCRGTKTVLLDSKNTPAWSQR